MFLTLTITGIIVSEQTLKPFRLRQILKDLSLLRAGIKFTAFLAKQEIKVYLTIIVC